MSLQKNNPLEERPTPANFCAFLPFSLPVVHPKKKKKCCKKFRKSNRCKSCPMR